ncbi:MAG TPA: YdcH family protein [Candidatus Angelobacter sp.]|nr:YdcH family protein [Candidatus Angelobacter sp.]
MVDSVREQLLASHEEFRRLAQEHSQHCDRLHSLIEKRYLTEDEKLEEVRIKKLKLHLKDQMQLIEQEYKRGQTQVA